MNKHDDCSIYYINCLAKTFTHELGHNLGFPDAPDWDLDEWVSMQIGPEEAIGYNDNPSDNIPGWQEIHLEYVTLMDT